MILHSRCSSGKCWEGREWRDDIALSVSAWQQRCSTPRRCSLFLGSNSFFFFFKGGMVGGGGGDFPWIELAWLCCPFDSSLLTAIYLPSVVYLPTIVYQCIYHLPCTSLPIICNVPLRLPSAMYQSAMHQCTYHLQCTTTVTICNVPAYLPSALHQCTYHHQCTTAVTICNVQISMH